MAWIPRTEENYHKLILEAKTESGTVRGLPGDDDGAWHTAELFYLFETIHRTWRRMTGYDYELQTKKADYFANFVKTGDPNGDGLVKWIPYTKGRHKAMDLGTMDGMIEIR